MLTSLLQGAAAGAAGTTALNAVTYLDMAARGRPASSTPQRTVEALAEAAGAELPGDEQARANRAQGLGPLVGTLAGVGSGIGLALLDRRGRAGLLGGSAIAGVFALLAGNGPMTILGVTDPRTWSAVDWLSDVVPHAAYGVVTAATLRALR